MWEKNVGKIQEEEKERKKNTRVIEIKEKKFQAFFSFSLVEDYSFFLSL
jgi:hypothetical protein